MIFAMDTPRSFVPQPLCKRWGPGEGEAVLMFLWQRFRQWTQFHFWYVVIMLERHSTDPSHRINHTFWLLSHFSCSRSTSASSRIFFDVWFCTTGAPNPDKSICMSIICIWSMIYNIYVTWFAFSKESIFLYCELGDKFVRDSQVRQNSQILELAWGNVGKPTKFDDWKTLFPWSIPQMNKFQIEFWSRWSIYIYIIIHFLFVDFC